MRKDFSPEEKLLRLIKGSKKKEPQKARSAAASPEAPSPSPKGARTEAVYHAPGKTAFNMRRLNYIFTAALAGLLLYFAYDIFFPSYEADKIDISRANEAPAKYVKPKEGGIADAKPYSEYSSAIRGRNIFLPQQTEAAPVVTGPSLDEVSANLSLIGIVAGPRPQAIIENKRTGKSYFLYKGSLVDKAKVLEILEGSVIMEYQGEKFELVL